LPEVRAVSQIRFALLPPALALIQIGTPLPAQTAVKLQTAGLIGEQIALFLPEGLDPAALPASLALLRPPAINAALPAAWSLRPTFSAAAGRFTAHLEVGKEVDLYGTGEVTGPLLRTGARIKLWNTDNYAYGKDAGRRLYQSHPWVLGLRPDGSAFGVLFDSSWKAELSCAGGITFSAQGPAFPVLVIERGSPQGVLAALADLTGHMELPPRWALGYQQSRYSYEPEARVRAIAAEFRARKLPCDVIWMDIDYMDGFRIFTFDPVKFPDPLKLNADLRRQGFHSVWMIDPGVKVDPGYPVYQQGSAAKAWVQDAAGAEFHGQVWPGACAFPDFTRPEVRAWWAGLYRPFLAKGVDGVWNDMNEPAVFDGEDGTMPEDNRHAGGGGLAPGPHRQYHNGYGTLMAQASREGMLAARPDTRPFILTRAGFLGAQRYAATWTGDNSSTQKDFELSIPMSLSLGLSGQPFNGPDLGGYNGDASGELWARWSAVGAFFPFCRGHASKKANAKEPWAFGPEVEATARIALLRRYRLLPYLYTCFEEAARTGMPVMRPLFLTDPRDPALRREQRAFLVGPDLLVVPAWAQDAARPKGTWLPLSLVAGDLKDPLQARLFLRAGAILPLGPEVQNTMEAPEGATALLVALDPQGRATGRLYHDAGDGFSYRTGDFRLATFEAARKAGGLDLSTAAVGGRKPPTHAVQLLLLAADGSQTEVPAGSRMAPGSGPG
jgi:alpha-glucosidase